MGFTNAIVGGAAALIRAAIKSPNYVPAASGWTVNKDGSAEFASLTTRGTFNGTNFVINSSGAFYYSPSEAANNLVQSSATANGIDSFGNHYLSGQVSYSNADGTATQLDGGAISLYTGTLAAGWTLKGQIFISLGGVIELITTAGVITSNNTLDNGAGGATFNGNVTVTGTLNVNGSGNTTTNGLPNGGLTGTSGGASAGTAHTHGPGSLSVVNGQHSHTL